MKLVVSTEKRNYGRYTCTQTFRGVVWEDVSCLIFNSTIDNEVDTILELAKAGEVVNTLIYINKQLNPLYFGVFAGVNADIYDDATMLDDEETLNYLEDNYHQTGMTVKSTDTDVETLTKFVSTVSKESPESLSKLVKNGFWLKTLEDSVKNVETSLVRTDEANTNMVAMFNKTSEIITELQAGQSRTNEEIEKLSVYLTDVEKKSQNKSNNTMFYFSTFQVPNTVPHVLYIQVVSPCRFLLSFIDAYRHYLKMNKQVNSKLLIATPSLKLNVKKYESFPRLVLETMNMRTLQTQDYFVTHEPKTQILQAFFNMQTDLYIVLDLMYGEPLLQGAKVTSLSAVSGLSDIKRFKLVNERCIIPQAGLNSNIVIPYITNFGLVKVGDKPAVVANATVKKTKYFENCNASSKNGSYVKLDKLLNL